MPVITRSDLAFDRPPALQATAPPEARGLARDEVRLLVSQPTGDGVRHIHTRFFCLAEFLQPGDLLVINQSATLPASLAATGAIGAFLVNLSTHYGDGVWLAEPRWSTSEPGPLPLEPSATIMIGAVSARLIGPHPGLPRLWFLRACGDLRVEMARRGRPIRYGYVTGHLPLDAYQTIFAHEPGSAEMPSAARPFTTRVMEALAQRGVEVAGLTLHTGVSSLEVETDTVEEQPLYAEPFRVPASCAAAVNQARCEGRRVIAVGTTVARALESAWDGAQVRPARGFTRCYIHPRRGVHTVDGLLSGFHDPYASHLAMLYAIGGKALVQDAYAEAVEQGYFWHEFGDSHLILTR